MRLACSPFGRVISGFVSFLPPTAILTLAGLLAPLLPFQPRWTDGSSSKAAGSRPNARLVLACVANKAAAANYRTEKNKKQNTGKLSELLRKTRRFEAGVVHVAHVSHVLQFSRGSAQRQAAGHERRRRQGLSIGQPSGRQRQRQPPDARPRPGRRAQPPSLLPTPSQSESRLRELFTCPFSPFYNNK